MFNVIKSLVSHFNNKSNRVVSTPITMRLTPNVSYTEDEFELYSFIQHELDYIESLLSH